MGATDRHKSAMLGGFLQAAFTSRALPGRVTPALGFRVLLQMGTAVEPQAGRAEELAAIRAHLRVGSAQVRATIATPECGILSAGVAYDIFDVRGFDYLAGHLTESLAL